jgi:plasmid maintenance system antidote protein VapI
MTPEDLRLAGERLYGSRWQTTLARRLKVSTRTVRRWLSGKNPIKETTAMAIRSLGPDKQC